MSNIEFDINQILLYRNLYILNLVDKFIVLAKTVIHKIVTLKKYISFIKGTYISNKPLSIKIRKYWYGLT